MISGSRPSGAVLILIFSASIGLSVYIWSANLEADWHIADDHEIHSALGADHQVTLKEASKLYLAGESGHPGVASRYRPAYWALRYLEMWLWGDSPRAWYAARIAMFALMLTAAWWTMARFSGLLLSTAWILLLAQPAYWSDIFARLGPPEAYAAPASAIVAFACTWLWRVETAEPTRAWRWRHRLAWIAAGLGAICAIGSKENFVFLPAALALVAWRERRRGKPGLMGLAMTTNSLALAALVTTATLFYVSRTGADFYGQPISGSATWPKLWAGIRNVGGLWFFPFGSATLVFVLNKSHRGGDTWRRVTESALNLFWAESAISVLLVSQLYFYRGRWESSSRYAFPGELLILLLWFLPVAFLVHSVLGELPINPRSRLGIRCAIAIVLVSPVLRFGFSENRRLSALNRLMTTHYMAVMRQVMAAANAEPGAVIALRAGELSAVEGTMAAESLLRFGGVKNPIVAVNEGTMAPGQISAGISNTPQLTAILLDLWNALWSGKYESFAPQETFRTATSCLELIPISPPAGTLGCKRFEVAWRYPARTVPVSKEKIDFRPPRRSRHRRDSPRRGNADISGHRPALSPSRHRSPAAPRARR